MELLMFFWYLEFLSNVQRMRMQIKLLLTWKIVLFSSSQSMFYCELTPSYKSCTPKFRIWIKVWQQQEKLLILLKGSGTRYVTCGQAISSKRYGWEGWPLFQPLQVWGKHTIILSQHFFLWLYFTMTFTEQKRKENKNKKTNKQTNNLKNSSQLIFESNLVNSLVRFLTNNITCLCLFSRAFP